MKTTLYLFIIFLFTFTNRALAQPVVADTLTPDEIKQLNSAIDRSTFTYAYLMDSFSKSGDSINAAKYLLKIDPYTLMFEGITPDSINKYLSGYKLTRTAKEKYTESFNKVYRAKRSVVYDTLKQMGEEDQLLRKEYRNAVDTASVHRIRRQMHITDTTHARYLQNYILKKGWPSLADGSMYAAIIAIHDHENHDFYIPHIKKAILSGNLEMGSLELILYWRSHNMSYLTFKHHLATHPYVSFNVTDILHDTVPTSMPEIIRTLKNCCPVRLFLFFESKDNQSYQNWADRYRSFTSAAFTEFNVTLYENLCKPSRTWETMDYSKGLSPSCWQPVEKDALPRLMFYITFDSKTGCEYCDMNKLYSEKKLVTHAINFETNQYGIKEASFGYIKSLAEWLIGNPTVNIQIDGHTDNDGDETMNMHLSEARADEVRKHLVAYGIDATRLTTKGYGATKPLQPNTTPEGKAANRRVEFIDLK